jgi:hypothetical protein
VSIDAPDRERGTAAREPTRQPIQEVAVEQELKQNLKQESIQLRGTTATMNFPESQKEPA